MVYMYIKRYLNKKTSRNLEVLFSLKAILIQYYGQLYGEIVWLFETRKETRTLYQSVLIWPHDVIGIWTASGSEDNALGCRDELFCCGTYKGTENKVILI